MNETSEGEQQMDVIQKRFDELAKLADKISESEKLTSVRKKCTVQIFTEPTQYYTEKVPDLDWDALVHWRTSVFELLSRVFGETSPTFREFDKASDPTGTADRQSYIGNLKPIFQSGKEQYEGGYLSNVQNLANAEVFSDELEQAEHFLKAGYKTPAAVTAGVVLETTLRKLCEQTDDLKPGDKLNRMNDDLAKAAVYNKMRADQVRAWAKIRNDAAHGHPEEFDESDVNRMIEGVREFVANQLS